MRPRPSAAPARMLCRFWLACLLLALGACSAPGPRTVHNPLELAPFRPFLTPARLLPFRTTGSVRLNYRGEAQSGDFILMAGLGQAYQFQLLTPLTGSLALEVRFDDRRLLVLDYTRETYFSGENTPENRHRLLGLDMSAAEFLLAVTGRLPEDDFAGSGGQRLSGGHLRMAGDGAVYDIWLDARGLPTRWVKTLHGRLIYRVEYRDYLELAAEPGAPLRLPRKIRVYTDQAKPVLILGVREISPGVAYDRPPGFDPPKGAQWRHEPLPPTGQ